MAESEALSKSARKRANKKARDAAADEEAPPAPAPAAKAEAAPKSKAKAKAEAAPAPAPEPKAKAKGKAKAAAEPEPAPKAEPKAKGKAKAEPKATAPAETQTKAKAEGKAKAKAKAKKQEEEQEPPQKQDDGIGHVEYDDGQGGEWEVASSVSKKQQKRQDRIAEQKAEEKRKEEEEHKTAKEAEKGAKAAAKAAASGKAPSQAKANAKVEAKAAAVTTPAVPAATPAATAAKEKEPEKPEKPEEPDPNVSATVKVPQEKIGRVIGPKGSNIALIKERTGVKAVDTTGGDVTIVGLPADVALAQTAIQELVDKGYMSLSFEDFKEGNVEVNPTAIPNIIGERGANIQVIKKECQVEIDIAQTDKNSKQQKPVKVSIAGGSVGVDKAKDIIKAIAAHGYHEVTHPGFSHRELDVEEHKYRFLIGKGGSEMRHIQNNYKVKVNIPREGSTSDKVVVVGAQDDVERAVKYIEKVLYDADQPRGRAAPDKAEGDWGDDGPEEAWMSAYMVKRR